MTREFKTYTPYSEYERYEAKTHDAMVLLLRRPIVESIERYEWLINELDRGIFKFHLFEIGSGSCWGLNKVRKKFPGKLVIGADINNVALTEGPPRVATNVVQSDLAKGLSFREGCFSTIVCFLVLEQIDPCMIGKLFNDLRSVAKSGAKLILATFNRHLFSPRGRRWFTPNRYEYTTEELRSQLVNNGWFPKKKYGQRFVEPHTYNLQAAIAQATEDALVRVPGLQEKPLIQIFSHRMLNILPSIMPYVSVEPAGEHSMRKPVIDLLVCQKA